MVGVGGVVSRAHSLSASETGARETHSIRPFGVVGFIQGVTLLFMASLRLGVTYMAIKDGKTRVFITIDNELLSRIEDYCAKNGRITKSDFFTYVSLVALTANDTLPVFLTDAFVRNAMEAEIRSQMRKVVEAQKALEELEARGVLGLA